MRSLFNSIFGNKNQDTVEYTTLNSDINNDDISIDNVTNTDDNHSNDNININDNTNDNTNNNMNDNMNNNTNDNMNDNTNDNASINIIENEFRDMIHLSMDELNYIKSLEFGRGIKYGFIITYIPFAIIFLVMCIYYLIK